MALLIGLVIFILWVWVGLELAEFAHRLYRRLTIYIKGGSKLWRKGN